MTKLVGVKMWPSLLIRLEAEAKAQFQTAPDLIRRILLERYGLLGNSTPSTKKKNR